MHSVWLREMTIEGMDIKRERIASGVVIVLFIISSILLSMLGLSVFIMITSLLFAVILFSALIEYIPLRWPSQKNTTCLSSNWIFLSMLLFLIGSEIFDYLVGNPFSLFHPTYWILTWSAVIAWFTGKMIVRQIFIFNKSR